MKGTATMASRSIPSVTSDPSQRASRLQVVSVKFFRKMSHESLPPEKILPSPSSRSDRRSMMPAHRRDFLKQAAAGSAALSLAASYARADGANERLVLGVIGPGGMGSHHVRALVQRKDVSIAWVCDVDANRLAAAAKAVEAGGSAPKAVKDMRTVYDQKDVDAVFIATPDHWHSPAAILACDAGKHVYVEKPCSHNIREGRLLVDAARRNKKIVQTGTQTRSSKHAVEAMQRIKDGAIGDVLVCRVWNSQLRKKNWQDQADRPAQVPGLRFVGRPGAHGSLPVQHAPRHLAVVVRFRLRGHGQRRRSRPGHWPLGPGRRDSPVHDHGAGRKIFL